MQAHTFPRAIERRNLLDPSCALLANRVHFAVKPTNYQFGNVARRFCGCSCSLVSKAGLAIRAGTPGSSGRKLTLISGRSGGDSSHLSKVSGLPLCHNKAAWISPGNFWKQVLNEEHFEIIQKYLEVLNKITSQGQNQEKQVSVDSSKQQIGIRCNWPTITAVALSLVVLAAPGPIFTDSSLTFSNFARADQLGQLRQTASLLEKAAEGLTKIKLDGEVGLQVLDKAVTVVTGSTFIDPKKLDEEIDALLSGEKNIQEEVVNGVNSAVQNLGSFAVDVVTNFNPAALSESAGTSISAALESGAERLAAFELSALVSLGERWLILTPLLVIPMAWEMKRLQKKSENEARQSKEKFEELSGQAQLRGERVRRELERIELRRQLMDAVSSLGKEALQPPRIKEEAGLIRRRIKDILQRLEELKPIEDSILLIPEFASAVSASGASPSDALAYLPASPTVDGDWNLIYVSEGDDNGRQQELPQFPGFGLDNIRQKVWQTGSMISSLATADDETHSLSPLLARNTAEIRLGPIGVFQVAVQGSWENLKDGERALVSFNTFSARPVELLGNRISPDVPELNLTLPTALQRRAEWAVVYVDNHVRINRGSQGQLFLFSKVE